MTDFVFLVPKLKFNRFQSFITNYQFKDNYSMPKHVFFYSQNKIAVAHIKIDIARFEFVGLLFWGYLKS